MPAYGNPNLDPRARAHVAGPAPEAFGSTKVGPQGWKHGIPLYLRVLNPFLALVSPSFKVLGGLGAENLKI